MSKEKKYYVITAACGGDRDIIYYIFRDESYFEAFIECNDYVCNEDSKAIANLIDNHKKVDGLFNWVSDSELLDKYLYEKFEKLFEKTFICVNSVKELIDFVKDGAIVDEVDIIIQ